jgi:Tfp pilus assembly protein PilO
MKELSLVSKILLAFILPLAIGFYFLILPQMKETAQLNSDITALRDSTTAVATAKEREEFKRQVEAVREAAMALMPASSEQYDISLQVEDLAKSKGLTITTLSVNAAQATTIPKTTAPKDDVSSSGVVETAQAAPVAPSSLKVTITLGVTGTYDQVKDLVSELPTLDRFIQIDQVQIGRSAGSDILATQVTAIAYYLPLVK